MNKLSLKINALLLILTSTVFVAIMIKYERIYELNMA